MSKSKLLPLSIALVATTWSGVHAVAQNAIEEVVVTDRKKSESLQEVPLSITPFTGDQLEKRDFFNLDDVANNTVGLDYLGGSTSGYQGSATIRGLAQGNLTDRVQNVAVFLDGIYLSRQSLANVALVDMERIEVVKGPQNSLYGRNAFSGAINYVTKKPTDEFEGYISTLQGPDNREQYRMSVSGPIIANRLLGRVGYGTDAYAGWFENTHPAAKVSPTGRYANGTDGDGKLGGFDDKGINLGLTFIASDTLEFTTSFFRSDLQRESQPSYILNGALEVARFGTEAFIDANSPLQTIATNARSTNSDLPELSQIVIGGTYQTGAFKTNPGPGTFVGTVGDGSYDANDDGIVVSDPNAANTDYGIPYTDYGCGIGVPCPDSRRVGAEDPRNQGFTAITDIISFGVNWDIDDQWSVVYNFGWIDHAGSTGGAADRNQLYGGIYSDSPGDNVRIQANAASARPIVELNTTSHEIRFDWAGNETWAASFGAFYSNVEDEQYDQTVFLDICTSEELYYGNNPVQTEEIEFIDGLSSACYEGWDPDAPSAIADTNSVGIFNFFDQVWNGAKGSDTLFEDKITAVFGAVDYFYTPELKFRVEMRYTEERKSVRRLTDNFGQGPGGSYSTPVSASGTFGTFNASQICAPGETTILFDAALDPGGTGDRDTGDANGNGDTEEFLAETPVACLPQKDSETFYYFTPRVGFDWQYDDDRMVYGYLANGVKAGGFNNTADLSQASYDEEENWTFELGTKNTFMDGTLRLNGAVYYITWDDYQASESPKVVNGPNSGTVVGNGGDIENYGIEIDGVWNISDEWFMDFGLSYSNPKFEDGVKYDAAERNFFFGCTPELLNEVETAKELETGKAPNGIIEFDSSSTTTINEAEPCGDSDISGNTLARISKEQYTAGINYGTMFDNGWSFDFRLDGNYRSKQYVTPLNAAWVKSRTLYNFSANFESPNEDWLVTIWGKNITDKDYVSGVFVIPLFNKYIVSLGQSESYGLNVKYSF